MNREFLIREKSEQLAFMLLPILFKLLPESFVLEYHKKRNPDEDSEVSELLEYIKDELRCRQAALLVRDSENNSNSKRNKNNHSFPYKKSIPSAAVLNTSTKTFCIFCKSSDHGNLI